MIIDIKGLDKAKLLQALFNNSKPLGLGFFASGSNSAMSLSEAQQIIAEGHLYFDYLKGRVMKIDISGDTLDPWGYDRDNGQGSVQQMVTTLRNSQEVTFKKANPTNKVEQLAAQGDIHLAINEAPLQIISYKK